MKKPNIIVIFTDQQRFDSLSSCGNSIIHTPNIDRIAAEGTRFTQHITPCQICAPSRASVFTGLYPRHHRLICNGMALDPNIATLPGILASAGYQTHGVGKHHLQPILAPKKFAMPESTAFWDREAAKDWTGPYFGLQTVEFVIGEADTAAEAGHYANWLKKSHPDAVGLLSADAALEPRPGDLDEVWKSAIPAELHYNTWIAERAVAFIQQTKTPFFLFVSFPDPHHPFQAPQPYCDRYDPDEVPLPQFVPGELQQMPPYYLELSRSSGQKFLQSYWESSDDSEQGFLLQTAGLKEASLRQAIAITYGMIEMIDDCVGRIFEALGENGLEEDTIILFTSDHGELFGDHGLLHKGPSPYRQLLEVPLLIKGPAIPLEQTIDALTSHIDLTPTLLHMAGIRSEDMAFDGLSILPLLKGEQNLIREALFAEYHPRGVYDLYNQTMLTDHWRLTLYPEHPEWGEFFDRIHDPFEHRNLFYEPESTTTIKELKKILANSYPPNPTVKARRIAKW